MSRFTSNARLCVLFSCLSAVADFIYVISSACRQAGFAAFSIPDYEK
jgi:hypothetical protein